MIESTTSVALGYGCGKDCACTDCQCDNCGC